MKVAIMQPYFFPYIGYFQLINAVDHFVFYDDVNFIKNGWINRNRILINNEPKYITIPCQKASPFKLINEIEPSLSNKERGKLLKSLKQAYAKAPFQSQVFPLFEEVISTDYSSIAELSISSIKRVSQYLDVNCCWHISSEEFPNKGIQRTERIIDITRKLNGTQYINPIGGIKLYSKEDFTEYNLKLSFLYSDKIIYSQGAKETFEPWLSILDVIMFNSPSETRTMLEQYSLK